MGNDNKTDNKDPKFNSSIQYLERIGNLINYIHQCVITESWDLAYLTLSQLYDELYPRLSKEQRDLIDPLEKHTTFLYKLKKNNMAIFDEWTFINNFRAWFRNLNNAAHQQKLIMEDKPTSEAWEI